VVVGFSSALNCVPSISILKQHAIGWGVAVLIVGEVFARFQLISSVEDSSELFAYKRFEILTGGVLLGLTAYCSKTQSYALAIIAFFALNRLYRSCTVLPGWERLFKGDWEPYNQTTQSRLFLTQQGFHLLQMLAIFCFYGSNGDLSVKNLSQGAVRTGTACLGSIFASSILSRPSILRYLNSHQDAFLAILTYERFFLCLEVLNILAITNLVSFSLTLGIRGLGIIPFKNVGIILRPLAALTGLGIFIWGLVFIPFHFVDRLKLVDHHILTNVVIQGALKNSKSSEFNISKLFFDLTIRTWRRAIALLEDIKWIFTPQVMKKRIEWMMTAGAFTDVLSDFAEGHVEANRIRNIFRVAVFLSFDYKTINFAEKYPHILTPYALASERYLWKYLKTEQIEQLLLTPELRTLLNEDDLGILSNQVETLSQKISELEKSYLIDRSLKNLKESEWESLFAELRPLYVPLDLFHFANLMYLLNLIPDGIKAAELVARLKNYKPTIEDIDSKFKELEDKLEHLTGDLFKHAYEGLSTLTVADLKLMLQEWGEGMESGPFLKIQRLLELKGIRWKGDLITQGILEQGVAPNNSKEALKTRLTELLHPAS
jgi:hypothetical protein